MSHQPSEPGMLWELDVFYTRNKIHPEAFDCDHRAACTAAIEGPYELTEAKSSYVGSKYEVAFPKLLFLSLDPGDPCTLPASRTPHGVRKRVIEDGVKRKWPHWWYTHQLAVGVLAKFPNEFPDIKWSEDKWVADQDLMKAQPFFAHVNSAKCCFRAKQATDTFFVNCRRYLKEEIEILEPDIVITQGNQAFRSFGEIFLNSSFSADSFESWCTRHHEELILRINKPEILWLTTYHPAYPRFYSNAKRRECVNACAEAAKKFIDDRQC